MCKSGKRTHKRTHKKQITEKWSKKEKKCFIVWSGRNLNFCPVIVPDSKNDPESDRVIQALENIDDDCDRNGIILVQNKLDFTIET